MAISKDCIEHYFPTPWKAISWDDGVIRDANNKFIAIIEDLEEREFIIESVNNYNIIIDTLEKAFIKNPELINNIFEKEFINKITEILNNRNEFIHS